MLLLHCKQGSTHSVWCQFSNTASILSCCTEGSILTGMNLHVARWTAEQETGAILSSVIVGGWRLSVACTDTEAHLWDKRTSQTAVTGNGGALAVISKKDIFVWLERPEKDDKALVDCISDYWWAFTMVRIELVVLIVNYTTNITTNLLNCDNYWFWNCHYYHYHYYFTDTYVLLLQCVAVPLCRDRRVNR